MSATQTLAVEKILIRHKFTESLLKTGSCATQDVLPFCPFIKHLRKGKMKAILS